MIYISLLLLSCLAAGQNLVELESRAGKYVAGAPTELRYCIDQQLVNGAFSLMLDNGTARIQMNQVARGTQITFKLPHALVQKSGVLTARLFYNSTIVHQSSLEIMPDVDNATRVESYCGPKHLVVNRGDYTMIVSTVLDEFGNPFPKEETVTAGYHSMNRIIEKPMRMRPLFGYQRLYAPDRKGFGNVIGKYGELVGKAFRVDYYAVDPLDFSIAYERQHPFADGEQLVIFKTETIRDASDNIIGNGTIVKFLINNSDGTTAELYAQTLDGIATAVRYAPEKAESWKVTAGIANYADSRNTLEIAFEESVADFSISHLTTARKVLIGPITGYMGQWMKNGTVVKIEVTGPDTHLLFKKPLQDGEVMLKEQQLRLAKGKYLLKATVAGITKSINITIND